jgi:hypothetical protein
VRGVKEQESYCYFMCVCAEQRGFRINSYSTIWPGKRDPRLLQLEEKMHVATAKVRHCSSKMQVAFRKT